MSAGTSAHEFKNNKSFRRSNTFASSMEAPADSCPLPNALKKPIHGEEMHHFSHPQHPLVNVNFPYIFTCMGCKEYGAGKRFMCQKCDFDLHDFCASAPPSLQAHPLHKQHPLVFHTKSSGIIRSSCDVCGKAAKGYTFRCSACSFEMHPCCSLLRNKMDFPAHPHTLTLLPATTLTNGDSGIICSECKRKRSGRVYRCNVCDYHLHAVCAKDMINGLHASGITSPLKPSMLGAAAKLASNMVLGFIGGLIEGIGEGVGGAIVDNIGKGTPTTPTRRRTQ